MQSEASEHERRSNGHLNDEDAAKARTRVSRACTRCRTRKDKCNGERPSCSACLSAGQICNYEPATKKRGLPEGYVRGLEKLFALLISKIDGFEDATSHILLEHRNELSKIWNHTTVGEDLHTSWKESKIVHELEGLLSSLDQTNATAGQKRKREREDEESAENETDLSFHTRQQYIVSNLGSGIKPSTLSISTSSIKTIPPLPPNALQLVDHYFAHTHCWFPVLHRPHVTRACYELGRGKSQESNEATAPLLWAIFAYTTSQLKPIRQSQNPGDSPEDNSEVLDFRLKSLSFMPDHTENLKIVHAQAFLILALLDIGLGSWKSAWDSVGRAVRIVLSVAAANRLAAKPTTGLTQGCAILDVVIASHLRCVPHIRRTDIEALSPMSEDGHEEWEPWCAPNMAPDLQREPSFSISCFNRLTEIFLTIGDVLALQPHIDKIDKTYIQSLLAKLHQLQTTFPGQMPPNSQSPPHQIYLQLCHVSAQIRLVEVPVDSGAGLHERAKLACNVLSLLALCRNTPVIGLQHVPPFIVDGLEAALRLANSSKSSFGPLTGLPSFEDFYKTANGFLAGMSSTWPTYANAYNSHRNSSQAPSLGSGPFTPSPMAQPSIITSTHRAPSLRAQKSSPVTMQNSGITSSYRHSRVHSGIPALSNNRAMSTDNIGGFQYGTFNPDSSMLAEMTSTPSQLNDRPIGGFQDDLDTGNLSGAIDFDMNSNEFSGPVGIAMPETSPSFQGDEIDAIFHEMAHLDTNEWNNERALGLKDFGFTDDLTFQAFCNDPDRLLAPSLGPQQTLSSESQTWMFAGADLS